MTERETLEARAAELDVKFPANIGDEKLAAKVAKAEEKLKGDASRGDDGSAGDGTPQDQSNGAAGTANDGDTGSGENGDQGDEKGDAPSGSVWRVQCLVAGGRRRAGQRWAGGVTDVSVDDLDEDQLKALDADPMITVKLIEAED